MVTAVGGVRRDAGGGKIVIARANVKTEFAGGVVRQEMSVAVDRRRGIEGSSASRNGITDGVVAISEWWQRIASRCFAVKCNRFLSVNKLATHGNTALYAPQACRNNTPRIWEPGPRSLRRVAGRLHLAVPCLVTDDRLQQGVLT